MLLWAPPFSRRCLLSSSRGAVRGVSQLQRLSGSQLLSTRLDGSSRSAGSQTEAPATGAGCTRPRLRATRPRLGVGGSQGHLTSSSGCRPRHSRRPSPGLAARGKCKMMPSSESGQPRRTCPPRGMGGPGTLGASRLRGTCQASLCPLQHTLCMVYGSWDRGRCFVLRPGTVHLCMPQRGCAVQACPGGQTDHPNAEGHQPPLCASHPLSPPPAMHGALSVGYLCPQGKTMGGTSQPCHPRRQAAIAAPCHELSSSARHHPLAGAPHPSLNHSSISRSLNTIWNGRQRSHTVPLSLPSSSSSSSSSSWSRDGRQSPCSKPLLWLWHGSNSRKRGGRQSRGTPHSPCLQQRAAGAATSSPAALRLVPRGRAGVGSRVAGHTCSSQLRQARLRQGGATSSQRHSNGSTGRGTSRLPQRAGRLTEVHHSQAVVGGRGRGTPAGRRNGGGHPLARPSQAAAAASGPR